MTKEEVMNYYKEREKKKEKELLVRTEIDIEIETIDVVVKFHLSHENDNY